MSLRPTQIEIVILAYNRPEYIISTIESVLSQDYKDFSVFISDNSTTDEVQNKITESGLLAKVQYERRLPSLSSLAHFNKVIDEVSSEFFIIFHDDDLMCSDAVTKLVAAIVSDKSLSAAAGNATIIEGENLTNKKFHATLLRGINVMDPTELANRYLNSELGHMPFPAYIYRSSKVKGLTLSFKEGQKHADVSFLLKVAKVGPIAWIPATIMKYRRHSENDSATLNLSAIMSLCRYIKRHTLAKSEAIHSFKMKNVYLWLRQNNNGLAKTSAWRTKVLKRSVLYFLIKNPKTIIKSLIKKIIF